MIFEVIMYPKLFLKKSILLVQITKIKRERNSVRKEQYEERNGWRGSGWVAR